MPAEMGHNSQRAIEVGSPSLLGSLISSLRDCIVLYCIIWLRSRSDADPAMTPHSEAAPPHHRTPLSPGAVARDLRDTLERFHRNTTRTHTYEPKNTCRHSRCQLQTLAQVPSPACHVPRKSPPLVCRTPFLALGKRSHARRASPISDADSANGRAKPSGVRGGARHIKRARPCPWLVEPRANTFPRPLPAPHNPAFPPARPGKPHILCRTAFLAPGKRNRAHRASPISDADSADY